MRGFGSLLGAFLIVIALQVPARAANTVTVSPATQKPTKSVTVAGTGFGAREAIDIYIDSTDTLLLVSTATGTFSVSLTLPASALPGQHYATAIGRHSGIAAQHAFTVSTPWSQFGFGAAHDSQNPYENVLSTSTVPSLGISWSKYLGTTGATPAVGNGRVYIATATGVAAANTVTGAQLWNVNLAANFSASPTVVGSALYIGDLNGNFYALNTATGATLWKAKLTGSIYGSAVVANGIVYVGSYAGNFYALQASTGKVLWTYALTSGIDTSAAYFDGNIYFGGYDDKVYCLNASSGALVWSYATGGHVESTPAIANGTLFVGSDDTKVYAIGVTSANAGLLLWSYTTGGAIYGSPTVYNGNVYIGSADDKLYALNTRTGSVYFSLTTGGLVRSAISANGVIYFTSQDNDFYAINSYGSILASASLGANYFGSPAVSDGSVFVATASGSLHALAAAAGNDAISAAKAPKLSSLHPDMRLRYTH